MAKPRSGAVKAGYILVTQMMLPSVASSRPAIEHRRLATTRRLDKYDKFARLRLKRRLTR